MYPSSLTYVTQSKCLFALLNFFFYCANFVKDEQLPNFEKVINQIRLINERHGSSYRFTMLNVLLCVLSCDLLNKYKKIKHFYEGGQFY